MWGRDQKAKEHKQHRGAGDRGAKGAWGDHLVQGRDCGGEATVHTENPVVDQSREAAACKGASESVMTTILSHHIENTSAQNLCSLLPSFLDIDFNRSTPTLVADPIGLSAALK